MGISWCRKSTPDTQRCEHHEHQLVQEVHTQHPIMPASCASAGAGSPHPTPNDASIMSISWCRKSKRDTQRCEHHGHQLVQEVHTRHPTTRASWASAGAGSPHPTPHNASIMSISLCRKSKRDTQRCEHHGHQLVQEVHTQHPTMRASWASAGAGSPDPTPHNASVMIISWCRKSALIMSIRWCKIHTRHPKMRAS